MTEGTAGAANEKVRTVALLNSDAPIMSLFAEGHLLTGEGAAVVADASCPSNGIVAGRIGSTVLARMSGPGALKVNCSDGHAAQGLYAATYYTRRATGAYALDVALAMEGGLAAAYFNNRWLFGDAVFNRTDALVNFDWASSKITDTGLDYISVRWTGWVQPAFGEEYTFFVTVNDGAKLTVDGVVLIDAFESTVEDAAVAVEHNGSIALVGGVLYDIVLEYRENNGLASIKMEWLSLSQKRQLVPSARLFHTSTPIVGSPFSVTPVSVKPTEPTATALAINDATALNLAWSAPENDGGRPGDSYSAALDRGVDLGALIVARALSGGVLRQQSKGRPTRQSELRYPKTQTCCSSPPANST